MLTRQVQDGYLDEWQQRAARYTLRVSRSVVVSLSLSRRNAASESEIHRIPKEAAALSKHLHNAAASLNCAPLMREGYSVCNLRGSILGITPARAGKTVMDSFICAISLLPVFKIYLISLQNICPPKNIKHVSPKYSYPPLFKEASHYVYSIIKSVL